MSRQLAAIIAFIATVTLQYSNTPQASAATIAGVTIFDVSSELTTDFNRDADFTVDGSGLSGPSPQAHNTTPDGNMWLNSGAGLNGDPADPTAAGVGAVITFDLGANYDLDSMRVWNYNESGAFTQRGANDVEILIANSLTSPSFVSVGNIDFAQASGATSYTGEFIDFVANSIVANNVRLLRFNISSNYGDASEFIGLSEIQFDGVETVVPEPATLLMWSVLGIVGFGGYVVRRRFR